MQRDVSERKYIEISSKWHLRSNTLRLYPHSPACLAFLFEVSHTIVAFGNTTCQRTNVRDNKVKRLVIK